MSEFVINGMAFSLKQGIFCWGVRKMHSAARTTLALLVVVLLCLGTKSLKGFKGLRAQPFEVATNIRVSRHLLDDGNDPRCINLHDMNESLRCEFVSKTHDCQNDDGFIPYIRLPYCAWSSVTALALTILILWLLFLFIVIGITTDDYFCPALTVISNALKLGPSVAGVTFLALGNGAQDIFSAVAGFVNSKSTEGLALSALTGAVMFITTIVVGTVSVRNNGELNLNRRPYTRDALFFLATLAWITIIIYRQEIDLFQSIGFIFLYVVYALVVIFGRVIYQKYKTNLNNQNNYSNKGSVQEPTSISEEREYFDESLPTVCRVNHTQQDEMTPLLVQMKKTPQTSGAASFLEELCSVSRSDFADSGILRKSYTVIKVPIHLCLNLTVPVVDLDEENHNWNQILQLLQCIFSPVFCVFATDAGIMMIGGKFPLAVLMAIFGILLAIVVALTSKRNEPPRYHQLFALMGFVASVVWIYCTANEIVNLLKMFGVVFKISDEVLGLTLLAWGNSIADFVADVAVAKQGFPQMSVAACFGGSLLTILLGLGISCTVATSKNDGTLTINTTTQDYITISFLALSLASSAVVIPILGFRIPRWYGIYLIVLYGAFLIVSILNEANVIFT